MLNNCKNLIFYLLMLNIEILVSTMEYVCTLEFDEEPDYKLIINAL